MDRINHVKVRTPNPEIVDAFLTQVCEIPGGWALGGIPLPPDAPLGPGGELDYEETTRSGSVGGRGKGGFVTGDERSRQFQVFASDTPRFWAVCIGTRNVERAHERCLARGIPATPVRVADWNERDNIRNFFCVVDGLMFEVIRVEPKQA